MSTIVKTGWLKDKEGNKFAPKTLTSQVQTSDGKLIEDKIAETYATKNLVSATTDGLMSSTDKSKLDGIEAGATNTVVDDVLDGESLNPVQNKVIKAALDDLQDEVNGKVPTSLTINGKPLSDDITLSASDVGADSAGSASAALGSANSYTNSQIKSHGHPTDTTRASKAEFDEHISNHAPSDAEKNQNAFSNIKVGSTTVAADSATDTVEFVGDNVTITPDETNDKVTFAVPAAGSSLGVVKSGGDVSISDGVITVNGDSHNHVIDNIDGLQDALNAKITRKWLSGTCQQADYRMSVIALCKAPTTDTNNMPNSYAMGRLIFHRTTGLYTPTYADISMTSGYYSVGKINTHYITHGYFKTFKPCTFTYNGVKYGGVEVQVDDSMANNIYFEGYSAIDIFALDIYDTSKKTVLNEEVYNSLSYDTVSVSKNFRNGGDLIITERGGTINEDLQVDGKLGISSIVPSRHLHATVKTAGWYRIFTSNIADSGGDTVHFVLSHNWSESSTESYEFSVSVGYAGNIVITQLSGVSGVINKIRVVYKNSNTYYIDFYYNFSKGNVVTVYGTGCGTFNAPTAVDSIPEGYSTREFTTVHGCKTSSNFTGDLKGNADSASKATSLSNSDSITTPDTGSGWTRPTSANVAVKGDGGVYAFKATSSMTEGTPAADSHILHFEWDNTGGWSGQIALPTSQSGSMQYRKMQDGTWQNWVSLIDSSTIGSQSVASATKATEDGNGNTITSTYATKTELNNLDETLSNVIDNGLAEKADKRQLQYITVTSDRSLTIQDDTTYFLVNDDNYHITFNPVDTKINATVWIYTDSDEPDFSVPTTWTEESYTYGTQKTTYLTRITFCGGVYVPELCGGY